MSGFYPRLTQGTKVPLLQDGTFGTVTSTLLELIDQAQLADIHCKLVAVGSFWLQKGQHPANMPINEIEAEINAAKAQVAARPKLLDELDFALRITRFIDGLIGIDDFAEIFLCWFSGLIPKEDVPKIREIYRPWNKDGVEGCKFSRAYLTPLEFVPLHGANQAMQGKIRSL